MFQSINEALSFTSSMIYPVQAPTSGIVDREKEPTELLGGALIGKIS